MSLQKTIDFMSDNVPFLTNYVFLYILDNSEMIVIFSLTLLPFVYKIILSNIKAKYFLNVFLLSENSYLGERKYCTVHPNFKIETVIKEKLVMIE